MRKRKLRIAVSMAMVALVTIFPIATFAEEPADSNETVYTVDGDKTVGNISVESNEEDMSAVGANAFAPNGAGNDATLTVKGDVSATSGGESYGSDAVIVDSHQNGTVTVNVEGEVKATATSSPDSDEYISHATGVYGYASDDGTTNINVEKGITSSNTGDGISRGIEINGVDNSTISVKSNGDVVSKSSMDANGINIYQEDKSKSDITINGNVVSTGDRTASAIEVYSPDSGQTDILVNGNVTATGKDYAGGVTLDQTGEDSVANIKIMGDLVSSGSGIDVIDYAFDYVDEDGNTIHVDNKFKGTANIVIDGTLDAKDVAISAANTENGTVNLTVWRIIPNKDGNVAETFDENDELVADTVTESRIMYIIKIEEGEGYALLASNANGGELGTSEGYNIGFEGEKILVGIDVKDGYKLKAVYNGLTGEKVEIVKDADGKYYVVVPKGGGVYLSAEVEKVATTAVNNTAKLAAKNPTPPTGDNFNKMFAIVLMLISLVGIDTVVALKKKLNA